MGEIEKRTALNSNGVKSSSDMWRTFKGEHFVQWVSCPTAEQIAAYRAGDVRCRKVGDELFIHHMDQDKAAKVDATWEQKSGPLTL